ncbi:alanyl-tRNA synthetase [Salinibacter ruber]|uniref:alanine--tRNA ligase n=1 Tax=Salinibacter ruber TaxID=146919 RepID=UPI0021690158|nr:alanine--tRNA ligase [Salinibacter ruber]MCS3860513.1 alanyl-tRNA synthetase [Salinibacter ruber]
MSHAPMNPHLQSSADPSRSSEEIRQDFLQFFQAKGHEVVSSASLVPEGDGTLLFTNAGMNQFKDVFLGTGQRSYARAVDTQKCLRVSGKHNDLEEVGHDTYHHTFFEMLGNWSFGDYFKAEAIRWAWELLVERWGLAPDRLYATVHEGDDDFGLSADAEAYDLWLSETPLPEERVLYEPSKENFWMMGDTGPCGPCSELHVDLRPPEARQETPGRELVNVDHPQVMELWNLVFIQYNAQTDGSLEPLDDQHVDTGMGFERMVAVLQGKESTYDTDLFAPLLQAMADRSPREEIRGYDDLHIKDDDEHEQVRIALRVVADHIRAIAFAISDGVMPSNEGRGYVIRRILRRAVRYGYQTLELEEPFLHRLVDPLIEKMGGPFDGLAEQQEFIEQAIRSEEESFLETLGTGIEFFERVVPHVTGFQDTDGEESDRLLGALREDAQAMDLLEKAYVDTDDENDILHSFARTARGGTLPGQIAFLLHDTYGFPIDLTRLMARERDLDVDMEEYEKLMGRQKRRARESSTVGEATGEMEVSVSVEREVRLEGAEVTVTESSDWKRVKDDNEGSEFVGYDQTEIMTKVQSFRVLDTEEGKHRQIELMRTPFYAEAGGQVGDTGTLRFGDESVQVLDTQREGERIAHTVDTLPEDLGGPVEAVVDAERRNHIRAHHTATHLMHAVLRETLGDHVQQKGSLVAPDRLRFDFSHFDAVDEDTLRHIERRVNTAIQQNIPKQEARDVPIDEALDRGATALFDEQYGDRVRVITFDPDFSMELCGGTHVDATGEIGLFRFLSEGSVASGVRRVEAVAGKAALEHVESELETLTRARRQFRSLHTSLPEAIAEVQEERDRLAGEVDQLRRGQLSDQLDTFIAENAASVDGITVVTGRLDRASMDDLQELGQQFRDKLGEGAVGVLGSVGEDGEKAYVVATVADDLVDDGALRAGDLVGTLGDRLGGGGGGRPSLASAGGRDPEALDTVLDGVPALVRDRLE